MGHASFGSDSSDVQDEYPNQSPRKPLQTNAKAFRSGGENRQITILNCNRQFFRKLALF